MNAIGSGNTIGPIDPTNLKSQVQAAKAQSQPTLHADKQELDRVKTQIAVGAYTIDLGKLAQKIIDKQLMNN